MIVDPAVSICPGSDGVKYPSTGLNVTVYVPGVTLLIVTGYGPPVDEPHALVRAYLAHRRQRSEQILAALDAGPATIAELVPRVYADTSKKLWRAAAASMYAHLLHLGDVGEVVAEDDRPRRRSTWTRRR